jgi:NAD(P)H-hydrate repair Nnr-like enzyme with NAD(P)H-hydrate epimerase domain
VRHYYSADAIREAEAPLLARLPDGALMRRAAHGLALAIARELTDRRGAVAGTRVCAVVGSGDNGGDALWAATSLRRRGVAASAVVLNPVRVHAEALAATVGSSASSAARKISAGIRTRSLICSARQSVMGPPEAGEKATTPATPGGAPAAARRTSAPLKLLPQSTTGRRG